MVIDPRWLVYRIVNWQPFINSCRMRSKPVLHPVYQNPMPLISELLRALLESLELSLGVALEHLLHHLCLITLLHARMPQGAVRLTMIKYAVTAYNYGDDCWICIKMCGKACGLFLINCLTWANEGFAINVRNIVYTCAL